MNSSISSFAISFLVSLLGIVGALRTDREAHVLAILVVVFTTPLVLVSGKGGTGKSAVTAAVAIARARRGERVLTIDMGAGLGLGAHVGRDDLTYEPAEVRPGVWAMTLVRAAALDEYLKTHLHVPSGAPTRTLTSALAVLVDTAPGVREIISIGKPLHEVWQERWDAVIVDTPSLGQFQSYLRAPTTIADLVPTGNVRRQASKLADALTDTDTTSLVLVSTPNELAVSETRETVAVITDEGLGPHPIVVMNRVVPDRGIGDHDLGAVPRGPYREAAVHQLAIRATQSQWRKALAAPVDLPFLMGVLTPGEVALRLADALPTTPLDGAR
ncbi:MAG: hypothetical protein KDB69_10710 [Acidimicrobiia bacterium]|nr:hypothetical protein [Acidimicrobiia bacterium]